MNITCSICDSSQAISHPTDSDGCDIECLRCGRYVIAGGMTINAYIPENKIYILSGVIRNLSDRGKKVVIHDGTILDLYNSVHIEEHPIEIINRIIEYHFENRDSPEFHYTWKVNNDYPLFYLRDRDHLQYYLKQAVDMGLLKRASIDGIEDRYALTIDGWKEVLENRKKKPKSNKAFVAMWFDKEMDSIWENGFYPAIDETGYKPYRIGIEEHNDKICDKIIADIRNSAFLVADFTGQRGGVYFEAGFALGLGLQVIWTCREDEIKNVHFDTRQYNHIVWKDADDLKEKLLNRINATVNI